MNISIEILAFLDLMFTLHVTLGTFLINQTWLPGLVPMRASNASEMHFVAVISRSPLVWVMAVGWGEAEGRRSGGCGVDYAKRVIAKTSNLGNLMGRLWLSSMVHKFGSITL